MKAQVYKDKAGEWRWRMIASNGNVTADSGEGYVNKQDSIDAARKVLATGQSDDQTNELEVLEDKEKGDASNG